MTTFQINGTEYSSRPMDAFVQIKIMKHLARIAPALKAIAGSGLVGLKAESDPEAKAPPAPDLDLDPIFAAVADMPDDDVDFVINACCAVTSRRSEVGQGWSNVILNGVFMHQQDQRPTVLLLIAWNVLRENFDQFLGLAKRVRAEL